jgi:hypothetical protein
MLHLMEQVIKYLFSENCSILSRNSQRYISVWRIKRIKDRIWCIVKRIDGIKLSKMARIYSEKLSLMKYDIKIKMQIKIYNKITYIIIISSIILKTQLNNQKLIQSQIF